MRRNKSVVAELVPVADRIRWMVGCRSALVGALFATWSVATRGREPVPGLMYASFAWLVITLLPAYPVMWRQRDDGPVRSIVRVGFTIGLLGDGVLLVGAWYRFGGLDGLVGYVIALHCVAVTLLASFRTGVKLVMWHSLLILIAVEATIAGALQPARGVTMAVSRIGLYLMVLWATVLCTASFAAVNERELRRRRYDSEVLRAFGFALADDHDAVSIAQRLARFARQELLTSRATVIMQPVADDTAPAEDGLMLIVGADDERTVASIQWPVGLGSEADAVVRRALCGRRTLLVSRLDPDRDRHLAQALPGARNLVVVPFSFEQVTGVVVIEYPRRSSQRRSQRIERRMVTTAEQATAHAAMAIGRAILVNRTRAAAESDGLTGVANRRRFDRALDVAVARADAGGAGFGLILVDLDHFKALNDRHGHQVGDEVLRAAARSMAAVCRDSDLPARYGGEEFAVIVDNADTAFCLAAAERIREAIRTVDTAVPVTASVGVAMYPNDGGTAADVLAAADAALYVAKAAGRDRVEAYRPQRRAA
jgi:two-component system cell cycle response regulator